MSLLRVGLCLQGSLKPSGLERRCPWCHDGLSSGGREVLTVCAGCLAVHHADCWAEAGACATCRTPWCERGPTKDSQPCSGALARALTWGRRHARGLLAGGVWFSLAGAVCALGEPRGQERLAVALAWLLASWLCLLGWCWAGRRRVAPRYGAGVGAPRRTTTAYHTPAEPRRPA